MTLLSQSGTISRTLGAALLLGTLCMNRANADSTWTFTGTCSDCLDSNGNPGIGTGTLYEYDGGINLSGTGPAYAGSYFEFDYSSPWINYTIYGARVFVFDSDYVLAALPGAFSIGPGSYVSISGFGDVNHTSLYQDPNGIFPDGEGTFFDQYIYFYSYGPDYTFGGGSPGEWGTGHFEGKADVGSSASWSSAAVPEIDMATASGGVTMLSGLLLVARGRRRTA